MKSSTGAALAPDADFTAVMGVDARRPSRARPRLGRLSAAPQLPGGQGRGRAAVATAAVFTVQDAPGHMARLAANVATRPAPVLTALTLCGAGRHLALRRRHAGARLPAVEDDRFSEIHGRFSVPIYQAGTPPYETPAKGGGIVETARRPRARAHRAGLLRADDPEGRDARRRPAGRWSSTTTARAARCARSSRTASRSGSRRRHARRAGFSFDAVEHGARKRRLDEAARTISSSTR